MNIRTVMVLGANGSMGRNVSAIFASFGNAKVYMMCRDMPSCFVSSVFLRECSCVWESSIKTRNIGPIAEHSQIFSGNLIYIPQEAAGT